MKIMQKLPPLSFMAGKRSIVIGCDDVYILPAILNCAREATSFPPTIISATGITDTVSIAETIRPDLIILCFRNNQQSLNDFFLRSKQPGLPIICITHKFENETLKWNKDCIVFTCPVENINDKNYLTLRIQSVFLLGNKTPVQYPAQDNFRHGQFEGTKDLSLHVMELDQKVEFLLRIKDRIADLYPQVDDPTRKKLVSIVNSIKMSANNNKLWDDFKLYYEQKNPDFLMFLAKKHPELTAKDLKYCCYLKMNMSNDDIRNLLGINQESVRTHKYRLKKKMALSKEQDLRKYLCSVMQPQKNLYN